MLLRSREGAVTQGSPVPIIVIVGLDLSSSSCGCLLLLLCRQSPLLLLPPRHLKLMCPLPILACNLGLKRQRLEILRRYPRPVPSLSPLSMSPISWPFALVNVCSWGHALWGCGVRPFFSLISFPATAYSSLTSSSAKPKTIPGRRHCHHFSLNLNPIVHRLFHRCRCPDRCLTIPNLLEVP